MNKVIRLSSARDIGAVGVVGAVEAAGLENTSGVGLTGVGPRPPARFGEAESRLFSDAFAESFSNAAIPEREREELMLDQLDRRDRLRLVEFVCSFAWADLEIKPEERVFISRLIRRLGLDEEEDLQVQQWLDRPPGIDGLDPTSIPSAHRLIFVEAIEGLIGADGEISDEERESFDIFKQLLEA